MSNLFKPPAGTPTAAIIATVQAAADYQDRNAERPPLPPPMPAAPCHMTSQQQLAAWHALVSAGLKS